MSSNNQSAKDPSQAKSPSSPSCSGCEADDFGKNQGNPNLSVLGGYGWKFLRLFPKYAVVLVTLSLISSVVMVATPLLLGKITNDIKMTGKTAPLSPGGNATKGDASSGSQEQASVSKDSPVKPVSSSVTEKQELVWSYVLWLVCAFGGIGLSLGIRYSQSALDVNMANAIRERLFSRIIRERLEFFHANDVGRLTMIINQMSIEAQITFRQTILDPLFQLVNFLFAVSGLMFSFSQLQQEGGSLIIWIGVAVVLLFALLSPLLVSRMGSRLQSASANVMGQNMAVASLVNSSLKSPEEVQSFNAEEFFSTKYRANLEKIRTSRIRQTLTVEFINTLNSLPTILIQILFIGVALLMVLMQSSAAAQAGYVVSILLLVPMLMMPIQAISNYMVMLRSSWPSVETVLRHLKDLPPVAALPPRAANEKPLAELESRNIIFRYRPDLPAVLDNVSFSVPAGKITGLVAKMGQGKTTFFRLALGFYQPQQGEVILGGRSVRD